MRPSAEASMRNGNSAALRSVTEQAMLKPMNDRTGSHVVKRCSTPENH